MEWISRRRTKKIKIGNVYIGGDAPISVQSMTKTDTRNIKQTLAQINELHEAGCEIVRCTIMDDEAVSAIKEIKKNSPVPIIADIHFQHRLAISSINAGVDGIRINPGNIGSWKKVKEIIEVAKERGTPIRIGVNSGSLEKSMLDKYGWPSADAMVESAHNWVRKFEDEGFTLIKVSIKSSDVKTTIITNEKISKLIDYPLHIGLTEAGPLQEGITKSSVALGTLLREGIGDTIRVSLSEHPVKEVDAAYEILSSLHLRKKHGVDIVSCPTCGRIQINLIPLVDTLKKRLSHIKKPIKIAVMGCMVNAMGEAREADLAICGGKKFGLIVVKGKIKEKVPESQLIEKFVREVENYAKNIPQ
ncbi:MAG: flavodoxin-dependent (E)-4-hydroxy-3-methylbut-2-enyl-diphosphate synthase [Deltaproteobacteria bacterium]|nr:flavodoxin-dependent (E)-4-hydroxy-3-methylbut-2-enyl-diphosphate synthase [Deltaproteobacteria bacterium]